MAVVACFFKSATELQRGDTVKGLLVMKLHLQKIMHQKMRFGLTRKTKELI
jgi:hypothetical protein